MSCMVMNPRATATLANAVEFILNSGFNRFGFEAPESLHKALSDCRDSYYFYSAPAIYQRFYALNVAAYNGRYLGNPTDPVEAEAPSMPDVPPLVKERVYCNHEILQPWHYKFCKLLDFLIYQCSEDATRNDPLFLALVDFDRIYKSFLVCNTEEYHHFGWGEP